LKASLSEARQAGKESANGKGEKTTSKSKSKHKAQANSGAPWCSKVLMLGAGFVTRPTLDILSDAGIHVTVGAHYPFFLSFPSPLHSVLPYSSGYGRVCVFVHISNQTMVRH